MRNKTLFNLFLIAMIVAGLTTLVACKPADQPAETGEEVTTEPDTTDMPADVSEAEPSEEGDMSAADEEAAGAEEPADETATEGEGEPAAEAVPEG